MRREPARRERNGRGYWKKLSRQKDQILNVRAAEARQRTPLQHTIALTARLLAHPLFFAAELGFHLGWVTLNSYLPAGWRWDPYPFPLLTGLASAQALFIGLLILMYEERSARVAETREETELQVSLHTERETTKLLRMVAEIQRGMGIPSQEHDAELAEMAQPLDPERLHQATRERLDEIQE